jgi:hypothetical protein
MSLREIYLLTAKISRNLISKHIDRGSPWCLKSQSYTKAALETIFFLDRKEKTKQTRRYKGHVQRQISGTSNGHFRRVTPLHESYPEKVLTLRNEGLVTDCRSKAVLLSGG